MYVIRMASRYLFRSVVQIAKRTHINCPFESLKIMRHASIIPIIKNKISAVSCIQNNHLYDFNKLALFASIAGISYATLDQIECDDATSNEQPPTGNLYIGRKFKQVYKEQVFVKITNRNEKHKGMQYQDGLNIDINKFEPEGNNGIFFCKLEDCYNFICYGENIRTLTIPNDAIVYDYGCGLFKADKLIFGEKMKLGDHPIFKDIEFIKKAIKAHPGYRNHHNIMSYNEINADFVKEVIALIPSAINLFPNTLLTTVILKSFISARAWNIKHIPRELITNELVQLAILTNDKELDEWYKREQEYETKYPGHSDLHTWPLTFYVLQYIPVDLITNAMVWHAISRNGGIVNIPKQLITEKIANACKKLGYNIVDKCK